MPKEKAFDLTEKQLHSQHKRYLPDEVWEWVIQTIPATYEEVKATHDAESIHILSEMAWVRIQILDKAKHGQPEQSVTIEQKGKRGRRKDEERENLLREFVNTEHKKEVQETLVRNYRKGGGLPSVNELTENWNKLMRRWNQRYPQWALKKTEAMRKAYSRSMDWAEVNRNKKASTARAIEECLIDLGKIAAMRQECRRMLNQLIHDKKNNLSFLENAKKADLLAASWDLANDLCEQETRLILTLIEALNCLESMPEEQKPDYRQMTALLRPIVGDVYALRRRLDNLPPFSDV